VTARPSAPARASAPIAGLRRFENQTQNHASVVSTTSAAETAAIPQPVGSQKRAATMAKARSRAQTMTTGVPMWTWSNSQVASGMCMRMQPCDAE
jgi:hypothetical protein